MGTTRVTLIWGYPESVMFQTPWLSFCPLTVSLVFFLEEGEEDEEEEEGKHPPSPTLPPLLPPQDPQLKRLKAWAPERRLGSSTSTMGYQVTQHRHREYPLQKLRGGTGTKVCRAKIPPIKRRLWTVACLPHQQNKLDSSEFFLSFAQSHLHTVNTALWWHLNSRILCLGLV